MNPNPKRECEAVVVAAPQQRQTVLWIIAILLAIIATALVVGPRSPLGVQPTFGDMPMGGTGGVFAFTGQLDRNRYGLFMVDVDSGNVWCYEYLPASRKLMLVAARSFKYDRYLDDYNNDEDTAPEVIRTFLEAERQRKERNSRGGTATDEDDDPLGTAIPGFPIQQPDGEQD
ncbi:MAG: hypothetical protein ABII12_11575 [Planctomycetota bacterium]